MLLAQLLSVLSTRCRARRVARLLILRHYPFTTRCQPMWESWAETSREDNELGNDLQTDSQ